jgi:hypothetical protein
MQRPLSRGVCGNVNYRRHVTQCSLFMVFWSKAAKALSTRRRQKA